MNNTIIELARKQAEEQYNKKVEQLNAQMKADEEVIQKVLLLIKNKTLYKTDRNHHYHLVTEDIFKQDYLKDTDSWRKGVRFLSSDTTRLYNTGLVEVNGERYYDIRYILENYEKDINKRKDKLIRLQDELIRLQDEIRNIEDSLTELKREFPSIKVAIEEWLQYKSEHEKEYEDLW